MEYSVCVPAVLGGLSPRAALRIVREAGFSLYEIWSWWDQDMAAFSAAQQEEGIGIAALCTPFISLVREECRGDYLEGLKRTIGICRQMNCPVIISQVGQAVAGMPRGRQHDSIVEGLRACVPLLEEAGLILTIEPLNTRIDHPGYYLWSVEEAFDIIDEVQSPYVKVLYDLYHQYVMDDLNLSQIVRRIDSIGHFHMAGYPGRHEPMRDSEVDYPAILRAIRDSGYRGSVGQEYFPIHPAAEGLRALRNQFDQL